MPSEPTQKDIEQAHVVEAVVGAVLNVASNESVVNAIASTLAQARAEGRAEGLEAAALICDSMSGWRDWAALKDKRFPGAPCEASAAADYIGERIRAAARGGGG